MSESLEVKVWDPAVRVFHWSLVTAFVVAYLTAEVVLGIHVWAGYTVLALILFRFLWGVIGTRHARFADFVRPPGEVLDYLRDVLQFRARRYLGHNPAGGAMIVALLVSLFLTTVSGVVLYGIEESRGPLAGLLGGMGGFAEDAAEGVHEFFANFTVFLVVVHVGGVLFESLLHRENLIRAMWTGRKHA